MPLTHRMHRFAVPLLGASWQKRIGWWLGVVLACLAPICALLTYWLAADQGPFDDNASALRVMVVVDFCLALMLIGVIAWRLGRMVISKRARSAGSRLHLRMVRLFTFVAVAPALLLGLFAAITVTFTLDGWLNRHVGDVVKNSVEIAEGYVKARHQAIRIDAASIAQAVERSSPFGVPSLNEINRTLAQQARGRDELEIYIIDSGGQLLARSPNSYLFLFTPPDLRHLEIASNSGVYVFEDAQNQSVRALAPLAGIFDAYLYLSRPVDGEALTMLSNTREMASRYVNLENARGDIELTLALLYIAFAMLILSAAIWFGIWFADRLARPIGRLAGAADRVAKGDLSVRVEETGGDDEIATLSRAFNRMTGQVERQRNALLEANSELDLRRRFTEAVLSGVTAGVVGFDPQGRVDLMNAAAREFLGDWEQGEASALNGSLPGLEELLQRAENSGNGVAEARLVLSNADEELEFLARVACQRGLRGVEGFVLTLDDMTALVSAQRSAAWGDVARRVAHEIRNPLTPIQLSADRLRRRFASQITERRPAFEKSVDTIVRQVEQIRRMVEEFSNYARLPSAEPEIVDFDELLDEVVGLQAAGSPINFVSEPQSTGLALVCDRGLIAQALTNLLRNATQAIGRQAEIVDDTSFAGQVSVLTRPVNDGIEIIIEDNGVGLPKLDRQKLFEPYVSARPGGSGLGLAIVDRIVQEHDGELSIMDMRDRQGARARLWLPLNLDAKVGHHPKIGSIPERMRLAVQAAE